ncbi:hypothetical protein EDB83DRAFT_2314068 [Lactarius deliciosus]|nr:hypothetical protein EDB83DRAFT_2314068 [Lactarius deliciosus]
MTEVGMKTQAQGAEFVLGPFQSSHLLHISRSLHAPRCTGNMAQHSPTAFRHAGSLAVSNSNHPPCDLGQGRTGGESRVDHIRNDEDITGTSSTTQPDNTTDATAAAKTTEGADSVDATVAHGMDAEDPSDTADITDADVYEQLTHNAQYFAAYPEQERSVEQASPAQSQSIEPQHPPPISPICSEPDDLNPLPELVVDRFPYGSAGVPVPGVHQGLLLHRTSLEGLGTSIWAPFRSQCDWEFAHWAKMRGPTSSAVAALLAVPQLVDRLELSYRNTRELDAIIDQELPGRPPFKCWDLLIGGETLHLYYRDIIQCLRSLFGDPELARDMVFAPERHYTERDRTCRVYSDMHTGDWWWAVQTSLESHRPGVTVIPVILSSDKTQLTLFRGNTAYPVYMTIGNVPKEIRRKPSHRAQILMGYIPTTKLTSLTNKAARRRALANLFHACVQIILAPIAGYGETGVAMKSGDGTWHRCHPIFALFVGDYPEQILVPTPQLRPSHTNIFVGGQRCTRVPCRVS